MKSLPEATVPSRDPGALSPRLFSGGRVVGAFVVILALLAGVLFITRAHEGTSPSPRTNQPSATFALTDSQAVATFQKLNRLRIQAYRQRDPSLVAEVVTSDSPLRHRVYQDIARLRTDGVLDKTRFRTREIDTRSNRASEIVLREVEVQKPRFVTETGKDVSRMHVSLLVTTDWTLRREGFDWKIFNSFVVNAHRLRAAG
jgi:hypothetical protein